MNAIRLIKKSTDEKKDVQHKENKKKYEWEQEIRDAGTPGS